jgi:hypothetical protein
MIHESVSPQAPEYPNKVVLLTPVANLLPASLILAAIRHQSLTPRKNFPLVSLPGAKFATGINDTGVMILKLFSGAWGKMIHEKL